MATQIHTKNPSDFPWVAATIMSLVALLAVARVLGASEGPPAEPSEPHPVVVASPWSGTFRTAEADHVAPYVELGSEVDHQTVVGVVENMERIRIRAGARGKIVDMLVSEGDEVRAGQILFVVKPPLPKPPF